MADEKIDVGGMIELWREEIKRNALPIGAVAIRRG